MNKDYAQFLAAVEVEADYELPVAAIIAEYEGGSPLIVVAKNNGLNVKVTRKILVDNGVTIGRRDVAKHPVERWVADYGVGNSLKTIAQKYGVAPETVRLSLLNAGVTTRPYAVAKEHPVSRWASDYKAGKTLAEIADDHGVSPDTVSARLVNAGVTIRSRGASNSLKNDPFVELWAAAYKAGKSLRQIAIEHDTQKSTVARRLKNAGVTMRPAVSPKRLLQIDTRKCTKTLDTRY